MENRIREFINDRNNRYIIISVLFFSLAAHLYSWVNPLFNHDDLIIVQDDWVWQASLGRYLIEYYVRFREHVPAPWLIGLLSIFFLILAVKIITEVLEIRSRVSVILISGVLSTFPTTAISNASYLPWADVYMLCLLLSVFAVYACVRIRYGWILSVMCMTLTLGLYQAYAETAVMLFLLWMVRKCIVCDEWRSILRKTLLFIGVMLLSGIIYYAGWKLYLHIFHVSPSSMKNGIYNIQDFGGYSIWELVKEAYLRVPDYFLHPMSVRENLDTWLHMLIGLLTLVPAVNVLLKCRKRIFVILLLLVSPLAMNFVYVLSKGYFHFLMMYSFSFFYLVTFLFFEVRSAADEKYRSVYYSGIEKAVLSALFLFVIFDNIIYANQTYLARGLEQSATLSAMTRIVDKMEHTEGYIPGETEVVFIGDLNSSNYNVKLRYLDRLWFYREYSVTHYESYRNYFNNILKYPLKTVPESSAADYQNTKEAAEMPAFPVGDYCRMVGGKLYVKLSDGSLMETQEFIKKDDE